MGLKLQRRKLRMILKIILLERLQEKPKNLFCTIHIWKQTKKWPVFEEPGIVIAILGYWRNLMSFFNNNVNKIVLRLNVTEYNSKMYSQCITDQHSCVLFQVFLKPIEFFKYFQWDYWTRMKIGIKIMQRLWFTFFHITW